MFRHYLKISKMSLNSEIRRHRNRDGDEGSSYRNRGRGRGRDEGSTYRRGAGGARGKHPPGLVRI